MNEFELIERHFRRENRDPAVRIAIGDDAAVVTPAPGKELAFSVDMLVEGRHFLPGVDPASLGHKALAVNLSDMAAMGATPRWALLAGALPDNDERWIEAFAHGLFTLAKRFNVALIGGDTTRGPRNLCVTIVGELPAGAAITRSGARSGDDVYVSGTLGDAALALAALSRGTTVAADLLATLRERLERPEPRVALGERLRGVATAAIDVSDGLTGDLAHILAASGVGAELELAKIPRSAAIAQRLTMDKPAGPPQGRAPEREARRYSSERALALACLLAGGDDYELCFTAPPSARERLAAIARELPLPLTRIGVVTALRGLRVRDEHGAELAQLPAAFDHFR